MRPASPRACVHILHIHIWSRATVLRPRDLIVQLPLLADSVIDRQVTSEVSSHSELDSIGLRTTNKTLGFTGYSRRHA